MYTSRAGKLLQRISRYAVGMDAKPQSVRRPGGRSARVRAAVHQAVLELLGQENWDDITIALVAERSGVHQATIYRRWGTLSTLIDDVVTDRLTTDSPLPDTGSLRSDLMWFARQVSDDLAGSQGSTYLRAAVLAGGLTSPPAPDGEGNAGGYYMLDRANQLQAMLDRATARGENPPGLLELLEVVVAPLYFHVLFIRHPAGPEHAVTLVDRLLALPRTDRA